MTREIEGSRQREGSFGERAVPIGESISPARRIEIDLGNGPNPFSFTHFGELNELTEGMRFRARNAILAADSTVHVIVHPYFFENEAGYQSIVAEVARNGVESLSPEERIDFRSFERAKERYLAELAKLLHEDFPKVVLLIEEGYRLDDTVERMLEFPTDLISLRSRECESNPSNTSWSTVNKTLYELGARRILVAGAYLHVDRPGCVGNALHELRWGRFDDVRLLGDATFCTL